MIDLSTIMQAKMGFGDFIINTELQKSQRLSNLFDAEIYLKREDTQIIRSYKIRGAYNLINNLSNEQKKKGIVAASAGNHAQGVALTCNNLKIKGTIFMPITTPGQKVYKTKKFGGDYIDVILIGDSFDDAFLKAKEFEKQTNGVFVHPFDDERIIAGQATIGFEIMQQFKGKPDIIICPVGGGGIVSGMICAITQLGNTTKIIGVEPFGASSMKLSLQNGVNTQLESIDTFIDGASVKKVGNLNFEICKNYGLEVFCAKENSVCTTILEFLREDGIVLEPAGALSVNILQNIKEKIKGKKIVCVLSGGNFDFERLPEIKERSMKFEGIKRYLIVSFPQRPGALKEFLSALGPNDDISRFEYLKKTNKEKAPALIGIETDNKGNFEKIFKNLETMKIKYEDITNNDMYFDLLI